MFLGSIFLLLGVGAWRGVFGYTPVEAAEPIANFGTGTITTFVALTAFANGCTAMTGVEAISDGVPAFREPAARTAARTPTLMGALAITMFVGISLLAHHFAIVPSERETVVSQLARVIFDGRNVF
jgi:amino acid transporter